METTAYIFTKRIIQRWGCPKTILADQAFSGKFKDMCNYYGIQLQHGLAYQHNTYGLVERTNRTIEEYLRNYVNGDKDNWDQYLQQAQFAVNSKKAEATKMSPHFVATGREPYFPIQRIIEIEEPELKSETEENRKSKNGQENEELKQKIEEKTREVDTRVKENIEKSQQEMIKKDTKKDESHEIGSWVAIVKHVTNTKLDSVKIGPYKIIERSKQHPANYKLLFMGIPGTDLDAHANDLITWKVTDEEVSTMEGMKLNTKGNSQGLARQIRIIKEKFNLKDKEDIELKHMVGQRIMVYWSQMKSEEPGMIVAHEGKGKFWVRYDYMKDEDGLNFILESLLTGRPPQWRYEEEEDRKPLEETSGQKKVNQK